MAGLLIKNAALEGGVRDILIEGGHIARIGASISDGSADRVIDRGGQLAISGFADCHSHIDKSHLNDGGRTSFVHGTGAVKGALTREQKKSFTVEDITSRAEKVILTAIRSGTLLLRTNCDVDAIVGLKGIEALLALKEKYRDLIRLQVAAFAQEGVFQDGKTPQLLNEALKMGADLVGGHLKRLGESRADRPRLGVGHLVGLHADRLLALGRADRRDLRVRAGNDLAHRVGGDGLIGARQAADGELRSAGELDRELHGPDERHEGRTDHENCGDDEPELPSPDERERRLAGVEVVAELVHGAHQSSPSVALRLLAASSACLRSAIV